MKMPRAMRTVNRRFTNRILGAWAPYVPPWAVVVHTGRKTGITYRTPIAVFIRGGVAVVGLPYGADTDWVRNLLSAGGGRLIRRGRDRALTNPRLVRADDPSEGRLVRNVARVGGKALVADLH